MKFKEYLENSRLDENVSSKNLQKDIINIFKDKSFVNLININIKKKKDTYYIDVEYKDENKDDTIKKSFNVKITLIRDRFMLRYYINNKEIKSGYVEREGKIANDIYNVIILKG